jgi:hypothetical protein
MSCKHGAGQVGRHWAELDLGGRRGVNTDNRHGDDDANERENAHGEPTFLAERASALQEFYQSDPEDSAASA